MRNAISRRTFLASSTLLAAGALVRGGEQPALVGSQLYGWGQFYEREGKSLGDHLDEVLSALRDAGYHYAEGNLDSRNPDQNARFADRSKAKGLKPVALYTGGRLHEKEAAEKAIAAIVRAGEICAKAGFQVINCNPDPIGRPKTAEELKIQAESLNALGRALRHAGLKLGVHNHTPEMVNEGREYRHNFTATDRAAVGFCYDVHWVFRGGVKPQQALEEFGDRVVSWHLRQSRNGVWIEDLDDGEVDYTWIARAADARHLPKILSVEIALEGGTKVTRGAVENHRRSRDYVRRIFGV